MVYTGDKLKKILLLFRGMLFGIIGEVNRKKFTENKEHARIFMQSIDSACVYVNASTRFTDGFEFGFGAEIGISTSKLHAYGPMGVRELTTTKFVVFGQGQVRD